MRRQVTAAALVGAILAVVIILAGSGGDVDRMTEGDGEIYQYVAGNDVSGGPDPTPFAQDPEDVHPAVVERGTSLRYGRVGFPALIWLFSAGRPQAMPYVQPILIVLAAARPEPPSRR